MPEAKREVVWREGREHEADVVAVGGTRFVVHEGLARTARAEHEWDVDIDDPQSVIRVLRSSRGRVDLFTFAQRLPHVVPRFDYIKEWDNVAAVRISTFNEWWTRPIVKETRNKVRKAQKAGVEIRQVEFDDDLLRGIVEIYNESPIRQGRPFVDYGKPPAELRRKLSTFAERSDFIAAYYEGALIGFLKLVSARTFTRTMHVMGSLDHRDKAPVNSLIARAVELCADRGVPYLVYGQYEYGKRGRRGLVEFKHYMGFEKVELPRYYVPLTGLGRLWLRARLHRGLVDMLPRTVVERLLAIRDKWYELHYAGRQSGGL